MERCQTLFKAGKVSDTWLCGGRIKVELCGADEELRIRMPGDPVAQTYFGSFVSNKFVITGFAKSSMWLTVVVFIG